MIESRDSRETTLVMRKVLSRGKLRLKRVQAVPGGISGGVLKLERVQVICPACGQQVEAIASDGRVKGYCAIAKQYVDFLVETKLERKSHRQDPEYQAKLIAYRAGKHPTSETRAKISAVLKTDEARAKRSAASKKLWQDPEYRAKQIAYRTGKHLTTETRAKISASLKRQHNNERKPRQ